LSCRDDAANKAWDIFVDGPRKPKNEVWYSSREGPLGTIEGHHTGACTEEAP